MGTGRRAVSRRKLLPKAQTKKNPDSRKETLPRLLPAETDERLWLTIPCKVAEKPDSKQSLLLVETGELGKVLSMFYQCQECTKLFHTRKAWMKHAGMVPNIMGNCKGG